MKAALNLMGLKGTQPRRPMPPMPETEVERLASSCARYRSTSRSVAMSESRMQDRPRVFARELMPFYPIASLMHTHLLAGKNTPWRIPVHPPTSAIQNIATSSATSIQNRRHAALFIPSVQPDGAGSL